MSVLIYKRDLKWEGSFTLWASYATTAKQPVFELLVLMAVVGVLPQIRVAVKQNLSGGVNGIIWVKSGPFWMMGPVGTSIAIGVPVEEPAP